MKTKVIVATTHIDLHNMQMSKEALESAAEQMNGTRKIKIGIEHDETIPPIGKTLRAWVEQAEDGEYRLVNEDEIFEGFQITHLHNGTVLLKQECETDRSPFNIDNDTENDRFVVMSDRINFGSEENWQDFLKDIRESSNVSFDEKKFMRKSLMPDPEIVIRLSKLLVQYLIAKKVLEQVGDKVIEATLEEVTKFYSLTRSLVVKAFKYVLPKNRPITYVFELPGKPLIQFVAHTTSTNLVLSALAQNNLESAIERAIQLHNLLKSEKIQFLLNDDCNWEFNYLLTETGAVIGTEKSFARRSKKLELLNQKVKLQNPASKKKMRRKDK